MSLVFRIAFRYLRALRRASTVQILSALSVTGVFLGSMAMLIVLSAFNGFEGLLRTVYHHQDPDLRILPAKGKTLRLDPARLQAIRKTAGVRGAFEILCDKASVQFGEGQMVAEVFAAEPAYFSCSRMDTTLLAGVFGVKQGNPGLVMVSEGIRQSLLISFQEQFTFLRLAYPKRSKILKPGSGKIFNSSVLKPVGSLGVDENRVFIPLETARTLMDRQEGCHFIDVFAEEGANLTEISRNIRAAGGSQVRVLDENQLHEDLFKVMKIEKLFVFMALGFIILISGFNLFVSSSMMVMSKKHDFSILGALGMESRNFGKIIRTAGFMLVLSGLIPGLLFGSGFCLLQMKYGFIPLGMSSTQIKAYPVALHLFDLLAISCWVCISALLALLVPAARASAIRLNRVTG